MSFDIYPAIDLRRGRVVRLQWGDPDRETAYGDDPAAAARRWLDAGAGWLHVVNLDGAFAEVGDDNWAALASITALGAQVQFGGGLRAMADVARAIDAGVTRIVLGTAALESPELAAAAVTRFGAARVAVGIDARDGLVRTHGWQTATAVTPVELAQSMAALGINTIIYTDINRDGVLSGVNVAGTAALAEASGLAVIASGGVRSLADVAALRARAAMGIAGVIIGRALYEAQVDLAAALTVAAGG